LVSWLRWVRSVVRVVARMRETCIWLTPMSSPISLWVRSSTNRSRRTWRGRSVRSAKARFSASRVSMVVKGEEEVARRCSPMVVGASREVAW
jgi:hypothetical protein